MKTNVMMVVFLALVLASCGGGSEEKSSLGADAGQFISEDAGTRATPDASVVRTDAGGMTREDASATSSVDASAVSSDAGPASADAASEEDAGSMQEVDAGVTEAQDAGSAVGEDAGLSGSDIVTIEVRSPESHVVVGIEDPSLPQTLNLSHFELCAHGGEARVKAIRMNLEGWFQEFPIKATVADRDFERNMSGGNDLVLQTETSPIIIADEACVNVDLELTLPVLRMERWMRYIRPSLNLVETENPTRVTYGDRNFQFGKRTVFWPEAKIFAAALNVTSDREVAYGSMGELVAHFNLCGAQYSSGTVTGAQFIVEGGPAGMEFPMRFSAYYGDVDGQWFSIAERNMTASAGDVIEWRAERPDGYPEDVSYGACLIFQMNLLFVPEGATDLRISFRSANSDVPIVVHPFQGGEERAFPATEPYSPEPWTQFRFVPPTPTVPYMVLSYNGPYDAYHTNWNIWSGDKRFCERPGVDDVCPLLSLSSDVYGIDRRFPVTLESLSLGVTMEGYETLGVKVVVDTPTSGESRSMEFTLNPGSNVLHMPIGVSLRQFNNFFFTAKVYLKDGLPAEDAASFFSSSLQFKVRGVGLEYADHSLPAYVLAPPTPGPYQMQMNELPYTGPEIVIHAPEIWLENNQQGAPLQLSIANGSQSAQVLSAIFRNQYGETEICELRFTHGTGKMNPVAENIAAQVSGTVFGLLEWTETDVVFKAPSGQCVQVQATRSFPLSVTIGNPTEPTVYGHPLQFRLIDMVAHPQRMPDEHVPVIVGIQGGRKVMLAVDNAVEGIPVIIVR